MKKIMKKVMISLFACTLLCGCGKGGKTTVAEEPPVEWKTKGFAVTGDIEEKQEFWIQKYIPWGMDGIKFDAETESISRQYGTTNTCAHDGCFYRLFSVSKLSYGVERWALQCYDTHTMEISVRELSYEELGQEKENNGLLTDMDVVSGDSFVFRWAEAEQNPDGMYRQTVNRIIYTDGEGGSSVTDLWDAYLEKGIVRDKMENAVSIQQSFCVCDGEGNTYVRAGETQRGYSDLYVFDREGKCLLEYRGNQDQTLDEPLRTESGELVYPSYDYSEGCYHFLWPDTEKKEMHTLAKLAGAKDIRRMLGMEGNNIYYQIADGIVRWNIGTGNRTLVLNFRDNGISTAFETMLVFRKEQPPVLRLYCNTFQRQEDWLVPLSAEELPKGESVYVADLVNKDPGSRQVKECVSLTIRKDPNMLFECESNAADADTFRTQVVAELVAGGGPDILYVSRADMKILQEKGLLLDLGELLPGETLEKLLPGVIEMGTIDGKLVGLAPSVRAEGMAVSSDTWTGDTWSLEDILELMEAGKLENAVYFTSGIRCAPLATVRFLTDWSMENSFLIDWEKRESHFEDERFIRLLEITNKIQTASDVDAEDVLEGRRIVLLTMNGVKSICEFSAYADRKDGRFVGFPTEGTCSNYLNTDGMIVVNANTKRTAEVRKYLECLLDDEIQELPALTFSPALSVKRILPEEIVQTPEGGYLWRDLELEVLRDGTTSLHHAEVFLESCVPGPGEHTELSRIIYEELEAMYAGNKSPGQTAEIIDSRIQMYLDEGN